MAKTVLHNEKIKPTERDSVAAARACASAGAAATDTLDNGVTVAATC